MASIFTSANAAVASTFDVVTVTAGAAVQLVRSVARAAGTLDELSLELADSVSLDIKLRKDVAAEERVWASAKRHTDLAQEAHLASRPNVAFDYAANYDVIVARLAAIAGIPPAKLSPPAKASKAKP